MAGAAGFGRRTGLRRPTLPVAARRLAQLSQAPPPACTARPGPSTLRTWAHCPSPRLPSLPAPPSPAAGRPQRPRPARLLWLRNPGAVPGARRPGPAAGPVHLSRRRWLAAATVVLAPWARAGCLPAGVSLCQFGLTFWLPFWHGPVSVGVLVNALNLLRMVPAKPPFKPSNFNPIMSVF